jgi:hypothetical protein
MTHTDNISAEQLRKVSNEIGSLVFKPTVEPLNIEAAGEGAGQPAEEGPFHLHPTLAIWKLKPETFAVLARSIPRGDLIDWVEPTNLLYHQIRFNDEVVVGFARSSLELSESSALAQIGAANDFSSSVDAAINFVEEKHEGDEFMSGDPVVRLLEIPSYQAFVLWLCIEERRESRVVTVQVVYETKLAPRTFLTSQTLFEALHQSGPLTGIRDDS